MTALARPAVVGGTVADGLFIVPSNIHLAVTAERLLLEHYRERRLHVQLEAVKDGYDYIVLDCPPNLGLITVNGIYYRGRDFGADHLRALCVGGDGRSAGLHTGDTGRGLAGVVDSTERL